MVCSTFLHVSINKAHGELISKVASQLTHKNSHAECHLLFLIYLVDRHYAALRVTGLVNTQLVFVIERTHCHTSERVSLAICSTELFKCSGL